MQANSDRRRRSRGILGGHSQDPAKKKSENKLARKSDLTGYGESWIEIDTDKIDEAVLALLCLTLHEGNRAWKGQDWDAMNRLYEKRFISNPAGKAKSVVFTEEASHDRNQLSKNCLPGANLVSAKRSCWLCLVI